MSIKPNAGPTNGLTVIREALIVRAPQAAIFSTALAGVPQTGSPVPVYHLPLELLQELNPLGMATITSWRYPVIGGIHPALADFRESKDGGTASFGGLSYGILAERFIQASQIAERALAANLEDLQPRLLDVPGLQFAALWLHGLAAEYFVSLLDGRPPGTAPLKLVNEIVPDLRARAATGSRREGTGGIDAADGQTGAPTN